MARIPMVAVVGAHSGLDSHERVVSRLVLKPLPDDWSEKYKRMGFGGAGSHNAGRSIEEQREKNRSRIAVGKTSDDSGTRGMNFFGSLAAVAVGRFSDIQVVLGTLACAAVRRGRAAHHVPSGRGSRCGRLVASPPRGDGGRLRKSRPGPSAHW